MVEGKRCILIIDDEIKMVRALKDFLQANQFHILEANEGEQGLEVYYEHQLEVDLILLDVMMPKYDGYEVLSEIRSNFSLVPIMMLTAREGEYNQIKGLEKGADDYLVKNFSPTLLLARIDALLRRVGKGNTCELQWEDMRMNITTRECYIENQVIELTKKEFDLLYCLMNNQGMAFTREQLLNDVWGYDYVGEERTIDTYIKQIRAKIKTSRNMIKTVHGIGYRFEVGA